jgi:hypothetical protein
MSSGNQAHKKARTTLEREHFENLVTKAERLLESRPRAYRIRLAFLAILGYAVIFGILFLLIALIASDQEEARHRARVDRMGPDQVALGAHGAAARL